LPPGAGPVPGGDGDEAVARHPEEPQATEVARAVPRGEDQALLRARLRAPGRPLRAAEGLLSKLVELDERIGEVFLDAVEIGARVRELGAEGTAELGGSEPLLVGALKGCIPFITDLSRAIPVHH